ncbi:Cysteine alpha-hairpin motif superfamily [Parasponia andersonii]|uniref:Cysteine alpha-hairpin motif superfamily n=1 Tax=Parasponia andersonii TaxID=3476 RepID=A0A2P5CEX2_PARAD|nr:Cysteine alpha-hairpin motif superfamily [Parasponia andersonii]
MPRRSSGAPRRAPLHSPPQPAPRAPPPAPVKGGNGSVMGGIGGTIADGMAWGTGMAMAHRAMDSVLGPRVIQYETAASPASAAATAPAPNTNSFDGSNGCGGQSNALQDCLNSFGSDISKCQFYMDMLRECRRSSETSNA